MSNNSKFALTPLAAAISATLAPAGTAQAQNEGAIAIDEIIVTARKRTENLQDIPADIQAIPQVVLERMGAKGIEDYSRFIPSVNVVSYAPGSADIVFRGVSTGGQGIAQAPASLYLDELPLTISGLQPEVRMVDINRVEALAGPQGTLFGAAAQSGTLRVITNQPDPSQFEAVVDLTLKRGEKTSTSHDVSAVVNLPFADGKAALRLVGFTAVDAGFIDNVFGHTPDTHQWYTLPPTWGVLDNAAVVENDWNSTDHDGGRATFRYEFNDQWAATTGVIYQRTVGEGDYHYDPFVGDLKVVKFNDAHRDDEWSNFNLTIEGDLGWAQLVSATSYFDRTLITLRDQTVYAKYYQAWACLYQFDPAVYTGYFVDPTTGAALLYPRYCQGPSSLSDTLLEKENNWWQDKFTQEVRLSGGGDRLNWIVGLFYEKAKDNEESDWGRPTSNSYQDSISLLYWESIYGAGFAPNARHSWESIDNIDYSHKAVFGELTWRINDHWTAGVGGRIFEQTNDTEYWVENPETQLNPEFVDNVALATGKTDDFVPKFTLSYHLDDDKMMYALYSEGFRPGGTNRGRGNPVLPRIYEPDKLRNAEIGAKTRWADGRVQVNLTYYDMTWRDYQLQVVDPSFLLGEPWQQVVANVGDASVEGAQLEVEVAVTNSLSLGMNGISVKAETTTDVDIDGDTSTIEIPVGTRLPLAPEFKASAWLDYNWETNFIPGTAFARLQFSHTGDSVNQIVPEMLGNSANPQLNTVSFAIADFRVGLIADSDWQVDFFISNLTDKRAHYSEASGFFEIPFSSVQDGRDGIARIYTNRPREYGIRFSKHWTN